MNGTLNQDVQNPLHPVASLASSLFLKGKGNFNAEAIAAIDAELDKIREQQELGPALASLVQVAQYLDRSDAKAASLTLLKVAMRYSFALEQLNKKAKHAQEDQGRQKLKAFSKFSGN